MPSGVGRRHRLGKEKAEIRTHHFIFLYFLRDCLDIDDYLVCLLGRGLPRVQHCPRFLVTVAHAMKTNDKCPIDDAQSIVRFSLVNGYWSSK